MSTVAVPHPRAAGRLRSLSPHLATVAASLDSFLVPQGTSSVDGTERAATKKRSLRIVALIAGASIAVFLPALILAGVPTQLWPQYIAAVIATVVIITWSLIVIPAGSRLVPVAVVADSLAIAGLGLVLGDYFHQLGLLFALVVAGHSTLHGFKPALLMALCGSILVPLTITKSLGLNLTDPVYAFTYLVGIATIPWIYVRLKNQGAEALRISASKYRALVEHVPAIVYTTDSGPDGVCEFVSPRAEELLGFPREAWTSEPGFWLGRVHPDDRDLVVAHWEKDRARSGTGSTAIEYRMMDATGQVRWVRDEASKLDVDGVPSQRSTGFLTDVTDRKELEEELQHQAFHDPLTGLPNRALFADRLGQALARAERRHESLAVLFLDLDEFKTINDAIGHEAGDELLVAVAGILRASMRRMDTAARLGGDEFAILLEDLTEAEAAQEAADRILAALDAPIAIAGREVVISASIGIASPTAEREGVAEIMRNADGAMYSAKRHGKRRHETFAPVMQEAVARRLELAGEMRQALERDEFTVHYQPVVRLVDGSITGFEALVRWQHPRRGLMLPNEFIPEAEETGQIIAIGRLVLERACRQAAIWQDTRADWHAHSMSVNVSARQFRDPALCESVAKALANAGLDASSLTLEITESTIMEDSEAALERLRSLKALGIRLAIDDFGTGYSSLSYLRRLPVDVLKVDKSFIDGIVGGGQALALARVIVSIGQTLKLDTVAEGVEMPAQAAALERMGCEVAQGFHFARPMIADDVATLIKMSRTDLPDAVLELVTT